MLTLHLRAPVVTRARTKEIAMITRACVLAVLLVGATPANAWVVGKWQCGELEVTLHKYAVHEPYDLTFHGDYQDLNRRLNFRFVGDEGAKLNGKSCRVLPDDPNDED
jgi:hypothetical protein